MSKEITDQADFIAGSGFWKTPIGKQWAEEQRRAWENINHEENMEMVFLDMKSCKIKRFEDE